jgi:hypothetical protein
MIADYRFDAVPFRPRRCRSRSYMRENRKSAIADYPRKPEDCGKSSRQEKKLAASVAESCWKRIAGMSSWAQARIDALSCGAARWRQTTLLLVLVGTLWSHGNGTSLKAAQNIPPAPAPPSRVDSRAQALLDQAIQALGGQAFLSFKTMTTSGRAFSISDEETTGFVTFESQVEYPDKRRFAYGSGKKKPIVLINNGDEGWEIYRMGLIHQPPEQARRWKITNACSLENLLRLRIREPGVLIQDAGSDFIENLAVRVLDILFANQVEVKLCLNKVNFLPVRVTYRVQNPQTREWEEYADIYGDYRSFQGIQTPMHITRFSNDERVSETFRNTAKYDEAFPPTLFQPPSGS